MTRLIFALALASQPFDSYLDYDGQLIELPPNACVAVSPIEFGPDGVLRIPNGIVCTDKLFADGFDGNG